MRPHNDNNVYILGAGFSAEAGLPLISSFLARMRDAADWLENNDRSDERTAIERVLRFRHESAAAGYRINIDLDNIEHLFSLADAGPSIASTEDICLAIAATIDFAGQSKLPIGRLRVSQTMGWPCTQLWRRTAVRCSPASPDDFEDVESSRYDYYVAILSGLVSNTTDAGKNVVITLNYDLVVEEALRRFNVPITYALTGPGVEIESDAEISAVGTGGFQILKLHGSVNWAQKESGAILVCRDYQSLRSRRLTPLLIPPTWRKSAGEAIQAVWDAAVRAISTATRIILIGFSIPSTDQHFKYLLSVGLKDNSSLRLVRIVDPRARELRGQYETVFREDQFKYGIVDVRDKRADEFFYDEAEIVSIARPLRHPGLSLVDDGRGNRIERR